MIVAILAVVVTATVAVVALYDKNHAPAEGAGRVQRRLGLNRKGLALMGLATASATLGVIQAVDSARSASQTKESLVQTLASLNQSSEREVALQNALDEARKESAIQSEALNAEVVKTTTALGKAQSKLEVLQQKLDETIAALDESLAGQATAQELLESNVAQLGEAKTEIGALRDQLKALRDARIRALEADLASAVELAKEIDAKAEYAGGRLSEYIMDLRSDPGNMHHAVNDLRNVTKEIREKIEAIRKLG